MNPHLQLITDPRLEREETVAALAAAAGAGIDSIQIRDKTASARDLLALATDAARVARSAGARLLVNDRVDVAVAVRAHGVHLAANSLPAGVARGMLEPWQLVGVSVHSVAEAVAAAAAGADYLTYGHIYPTPSHAGRPPRGLEALRGVVEAVRIPVLAIGGIDRDRVADVIATGCSGIAVISAILARRDVAAAASELRGALDRCGPVRRPFPERRD